MAAYGIENHAGTPVYVHAKVCVIDDVWASVGSDNFNRRSWTHDSELSCVVLDEEYARSLRLTLAAEHLDRLAEVEADGLEAGDGGLRRARRASSTPTPPARTGWTRGTPAAGWGSGRRDGCGGCRCPPLSPFQRRWAKVPLEVLHDPDGRPGPIRGGQDY